MGVDPALVVVTAGHIDHGKSALVEALTGTHPDRLPEEKARGISLDLGFASFEDARGRRVAFVDVPGHERLVRTMIAGAHGVDAGLLCVCASDGVMPQTREHLAILGLLGVARGVVALTRVDAADPELVELAAEDVAEALAGTPWESAPVVPCSAVTGDGLDALREALAALEPVEGSSAGPFRLAVDRVFTQPGHGTVVTGTSRGGTLSEGARVRVWPAGLEARVRGIQRHGASATAVSGRARVALNLAGVEAEALGRGDVVCADALPTPQVLDVAYTHVHPEVPLADGDAVRVLVGTAERLGRARRPGAGPVERGEAFVQVRLEAPLACLPGDRLVIRRASPVDTLGGGRVLDPWAPKVRPRDAVRWRTALTRLAQGDRRVLLERAGDAGLTAAEAARRAPGVTGVALGDRVVAEAVARRLEARVLEGLAGFHAARPLALGEPRRTLRTAVLDHVPERAFDALLEGLAAAGRIVLDGPLVRATGFAVALDADQEAERVAIAATIHGAGLDGLDVAALHARHPGEETEALVRLLEAEGVVVRIPGVGFVHAEVAHGLARALADWFGAHEGPLGPVDFKALTDLTRKGAIPWLEWADRRAWTRRTPEGRRAGPVLAEAAADLGRAVGPR